MRRRLADTATVTQRANGVPIPANRSLKRANVVRLAVSTTFAAIKEGQKHYKRIKITRTEVNLEVETEQSMRAVTKRSPSKVFMTR